MRSTLSGWEVDLTRRLKPFLDRLGHKARRMCPLHVAGSGSASSAIFSESINGSKPILRTR